MKKTVIILGIIGAILIAIGVPFKMMHWSGASVAILFGSTALAVYSLTYMFEKLQTAGAGIEKPFIIFFGLSGILMCMGFLFKVNHWPGAGAMIYTFFATYTILVILAIIRAINEKDKDLQYKYINNLIWLVGGMLMLTFPTIVRFFNLVLANIKSKKAGY
ncbi:MAG: hypothetical protein MZV63_44565 [Marinilabiliales bacterium]|nr:hypothetical protein [Marinilabiliales bacterium]